MNGLCAMHCVGHPVDDAHAVCDCGVEGCHGVVHARSRATLGRDLETRRREIAQHAGAHVSDAHKRCTSCRRRRRRRCRRCRRRRRPRRAWPVAASGLIVVAKVLPVAAWPWTVSATLGLGYGRSCALDRTLRPSRIRSCWGSCRAAGYSRSAQRHVWCSSARSRWLRILRATSRLLIDRSPA